MTFFISLFSSRENSPEIRRRTFGGVQNRNNSFLSPSPLASPYGSRSNSPARNSSYNNSPGFQRRLTTQSTGSNDKWSLRNTFLYYYVELSSRCKLNCRVRVNVDGPKSWNPLDRPLLSRQEL